MRRRTALVLAAVLLVPGLARATSENDIPGCILTTDPCTLNSVLTVSAGSTLDFGARTFQIGAAGAINVAGGDTLLIKAGTVRLLPGSIIRRLLSSNTGPTPGMRATDKPATNSSTLAGGSTNSPSGFIQSLATLARNLLGATPADTVMPSSRAICLRMASAMKVALPS